jgi:hypothetical protein
MADSTEAHEIDSKAVFYLDGYDPGAKKGCCFQVLGAVEG